MKLNRRHAILTGIAAAAATSGTGSVAASMFVREPEVSSRVPLTSQAVATAVAKCSVICDKLAQNSGLSKQLRSDSGDCRDICVATMRRLISSPVTPSATAPAVCQACADACQRVSDVCREESFVREVQASADVAQRCAGACRSLFG